MILVNEAYEYAVAGSPLLFQLFAWLQRGATLSNRVPTLIASTFLAFVSMAILTISVGIPCTGSPPPCGSDLMPYVVTPGLATTYEGCRLCVPQVLTPADTTGLTLNRLRPIVAISFCVLSLLANLALLVAFIRWSREQRSKG